MRRASHVVALALALASAFAVVAACVGNDPDAVGSDQGDASPGADGPASVGNTSGNGGGEAGGGAETGAPPICPAPKVACGSGCIDPVTYAGDPDNCGACGHACGAGSTCASKQCSVATILPSPGGAGLEIGSIAVDAEGIYFAHPPGTIGGHTASIGKCPLASCTTPVTLFNASSEVDNLLTAASAPGYLYYSDNADDHMFRIVTDGGWPATQFPGTSTACTDQPQHCTIDLLTSSGHPYPLVSDGTRIYMARNYAHQGTGGVVVALPSGASGNDFGAGGGSPVVLAALGLALDPDEATHRWLYVAGEQGPYAVETGTTSTVPFALTSSATALTGGIAVGKGLVLVTTSTGVRSIGTCPATGACPSGSLLGFFATSAGAEAMTGDGANVYWSATGHIYTCPFSGCPGDTPIPIATISTRVRAMTSDAKNIYWGDDLGGLYRLAK